MKSLLDSIESRIDPFDFDVFTPYMNSNLLKHTQRCQASSSTDVTVIVRKFFILLVCMSTLWWLWFRSQVLYGALVSLDKHGFSSVHHRGGGGAAASGQQEQHNLLALATSAGRFQLLPLGNQSRNVSAIMEAPKPRVRASHVC